MAERKGMARVFGEWRWEKYLAAALGLVCLVDAFVASGGFRELIRDGAFHSALLFVIGFYLSELRYRLLPDVRND